MLTKSFVLSIPFNNLAVSGGGGCIIKADGNCQLVLPGVHTCGPFEEEILHPWTGGLVVHLLGWGQGCAPNKECPPPSHPPYPIK